MEEIKKEAQTNLNKNNLTIENKIKIIKEKAIEQKDMEEKVEEYNWKTFEIDFYVDKKFPNTLTPYFEKHPKYNIVRINTVVHILITASDGYGYLINFTKYFKSEKKEGFFLITQELLNLLSGYGSEDKEEIKRYLQIISFVNLKGKMTNYENSLRLKLNSNEQGIFWGREIDFEEIEIGKGFKDNKELIHFLPDNSILLFMELRKLLAAKKAGHDNTFNQVNAILKKNGRRTKFCTKQPLKKINKFSINKIFKNNKSNFR